MRVYTRKNAQVWVETVLYTLIAFAIIGLVLAYAKPEIEKFQDKSIIKQSITLMSSLDSKISEVSQNGEGNRRIIELSVKKGSLKIDSANDSLIFDLESTSSYTEPGERYSEQGIEISSTEKGSKSRIILLKNYSGIINMTYNGKEDTKTFSQSTAVYRIYIENKGSSSDGPNVEVGIA